MDNKMAVFNNREFGSIRVIEENGNYLFCGFDVAKALGYAKPRNAINTHCKGALKRGALTEGGVQELTFIPEGDVYRLIVHSRLPGAETLLKKYPDIFQDVSTTIAFGAVTVLRAGEYYSDPGMPEKLTRRLEEEKDCSGAIPAVCVPGKPLPKRGSMPGTVLSLRDPRQVLRLPAGMRGAILRTEDLQGRTALQADEIVRWWNAKGPEQPFL